MLSNWDNSRMTAAGMGPVYKKEIPQGNLTLSMGGEEPSTRGFNTPGLRGIFGIALQKCSALLASMFIPPETQTNIVEKNKKPLTVPDICVDININTPIFEAVQGKAKLTIPEDEVICDDTKSIPFGCMFDQGLVAYEMNPVKNSDRYDMAKSALRTTAVSQGKNMDKKSCNQTESWTPFNLYDKSKMCNKNRKEKNRQNLQINIMEDMWQITDDLELDSDNEDCKSGLSLGCSITFSPSSIQTSPIDLLSKTSFPSLSTSIPKQNDSPTSILPGKRTPECDSEESFVMLFDMANPLAMIDVCSSSSTIPTVLANRQRCRQISECSDDSIVFCYENDENDTMFQTDYDDEDDSEEEETDQSSCEEDNEDAASHQPDSGFEERKVQFNMKPEVHVMRTWDFAYRQARKGEWEMAARDRERFKKRIQETDSVLSTVFDEKLRDKVYKERFSC